MGTQMVGVSPFPRMVNTQQYVPLGGGVQFPNNLGSIPPPPGYNFSNFIGQLYQGNLGGVVVPPPKVNSQ